MSESVKDCSNPWTWMMVTSDGTVKPCCFSSGNLGNLNEATAEAIWNGPIAVELRSFIKQNRIHPVCAGAPCKFVEGMRGESGPVAAVHARDMFDEDWYLARHPDVAAAVRGGGFASGWDHYDRHGRAEGRLARSTDAARTIPEADAPEQFDEDWYLATYPDVAAEVRRGGLASGWDHYDRFGRAEGRYARSAIKGAC